MSGQSKHAPKRTKAQREVDFEFIQRFWVKGQTHQEIADKLNAERDYDLDRRTISNDIRAIRKRLAESMDRTTADELARIDNLEREAWDAWERSKEERQRILRRQTNGGGGEPQTVSELRREEYVGDPRYMDQVRWCIDRRIKLLGFDAPKKIEATVTGSWADLMTEDEEETED